MNSKDSIIPEIDKMLLKKGHILHVCNLDYVEWLSHYWCEVCERVFFQNAGRIVYWDMRFSSADAFVKSRLKESDQFDNDGKYFDANINCKEIDIREIIE